MADQEVIKIVLPGRPPIKKNSARMVINPRTRKWMRVSQPAFYEWEKGAKYALLGWREPPIEHPINLECHFYVADNRVRDMSALLEAPQDVLVSMRILKDDNWKIVSGYDKSRVHVDPANPRTEIFITPL